MNKATKQHLLGILYEDMEKRFNLAKQNKDPRTEEYQRWLNELNLKEIQSEELKAILINKKEATRLYDMPIFITMLLNNELSKDQDLRGDIKDFETPSFF